jgi:hypothetical protein
MNSKAENELLSIDIPFRLWIDWFLANQEDLLNNFSEFSTTYHPFESIRFGFPAKIVKMDSISLVLIPLRFFSASYVTRVPKHPITTHFVIQEPPPAVYSSFWSFRNENFISSEHLLPT